MSKYQYLSKFLDVFTVANGVSSSYKRYLKNKRSSVIDDFADIAAQGYSKSPIERARLKRWIKGRISGIKPRTGSLATEEERKFFNDTMYLGFGNEMMDKRDAHRPRPRVPVRSTTTTGSIVPKSYHGKVLHELDENRYRPRSLALSKRSLNKLKSLILGKLPQDLVQEYYKELRDAGLSDDIINSSIKGLKANVTEDEKESIADRMRYMINNHENLPVSYRTDEGAIKLTEKEKRLIKFNKQLASSISFLLKGGSLKALGNFIDKLSGKLDPANLTGVAGAIETSYSEDIKYLSDRSIDMVTGTMLPSLSEAGGKVTPKIYGELINEIGERGLESSKLRQWYHNTDSPFIVIRYDMSYGAHFAWLKDMNRPFDICDVYSGQFFRSNDSHPFLGYKHDEPTEEMYNVAGIPSSRYEDEAEAYNAEKPGRSRTIKSFNYPRGDDTVHLPVFFTIASLINTFIKAGAIHDIFKNVYLILDVPKDHPKGWCYRTPIDLRLLIQQFNIVVPFPGEDIGRIQFKKDINQTVINIYGNYLFDKRDKKGNLIESESFTDKLESAVNSALLKIERLADVKTAVTIDRKKKLVVERYALEKAVGGADIDQHGIASRIMVKDFTSVLSDKGPIVANRTSSGDKIDGWMSNRLKMEGPKGRRRVSKTFVTLRRSVYKHRVVVAGKESIITSGIGDIIIHSKNMDYWLAQPGFTKETVRALLADQIADAVGDNISRVAKIGNHLRQSGKVEAISLFKTKLKDELSFRPTAKLKAVAKRFYAATSVTDQMRVIMGTLVKDHVLFKEVFMDTFEFLVKKTKNKLLHSLNESLTRYLTSQI